MIQTLIIFFLSILVGVLRARELIQVGLFLGPVVVGGAWAGGCLERVDHSADLGGHLLDRCGGEVPRWDRVVGGEAVGEVEAGGAATEAEERSVVGTRRRLRGGVGSEPDAGTLVGFPDLGDPLAPLSHPDPPVGFVRLALPLPMLFG